MLFEFSYLIPFCMGFVCHRLGELTSPLRRCRFTFIERQDFEMKIIVTLFLLLALFSPNTLANTAVYKDEFVGHPEGVNSVAFSPDGKLLASGSWDKTVQLWEVKTGEQRWLLTGHMASVISVAFSPEHKVLASGSADKTVRLWDTARGTSKQMLTGHTDAVTSVAFSRDGKLLASGSVDKTVRVWNAQNG